MFSEELILSSSCGLGSRSRPPMPAGLPRPRDPAYGTGRELCYDVGLGIDWGTKRDGNVVAAIGALGDEGANGVGHVYYVAWLDARYGMSYDKFFPVIEDVAAGFYAHTTVAETNGVGSYPSTVIHKRLMAQGTGSGDVFCLPTTAQANLEGFSKIHGLISEGRFVLPRDDQIVSHPVLRLVPREIRQRQYPHRWPPGPR